MRVFERRLGLGLAMALAHFHRQMGESTSTPTQPREAGYLAALAVSAAPQASLGIGPGAHVQSFPLFAGALAKGHHLPRKPPY